MSLIAGLIGASVVNKIFGDRGTSKQVKGQKRAREAIQGGLDDQRALLQPLIDAGMSGLPGLTDFVNNPVQFADTQGFKDIVNINRAGGSQDSGRLYSALQDRFQNNFRPQRLNELMSLVGLGANATGLQSRNIGDASNNIAGLNQNIGIARGRNEIGTGQSIADLLGSVGFLSALNRSSSGTFNDSVGIKGT